MKKSDSIKSLIEALHKAQASFKKAFKSEENPHFRSKYASIDDVWSACSEALHENGLTIIQPPYVRETKEGTVDSMVIETVLIHTSGEWISSEYLINPVKADPQAYKSAVTYARRTSLEALLCLVTTDDDAESAMKRDDDPVPNSLEETNYENYIMTHGTKTVKGSLLKNLTKIEMKNYLDYFKTLKSPRPELLREIELVEFYMNNLDALKQNVN